MNLLKFLKRSTNRPPESPIKLRIGGIPVKEKEINSEGLDIICKYEKCRLHAYKATDGKTMVGYKHDATEKFLPGERIKTNQALYYLRMDLEEIENRLAKYRLNCNQLSALLSLIHDIGWAEFAKSKLCADLRRWNKSKLANEFESFKTTNMDRRRKEKSLFLMPGNGSKLPWLH